MNKTIKIIIAIIVVVLVVWGLSGLTNKAPVETGPIKIGFMGPLSGEAAVLGEPSKKTVALAVEEINTTGGVDGRQLEVVYEDDKCDGKGGVSAAQKLVNIDKVQVILGSVCSGPALSAIPVIEAGKVLMFSGSASSPELSGKSLYFVRNIPSDSSQGEVLAEAAFDRKSYRKVAFLQEQTDYAIGISKSFESKFKSLGGEVVKEEFASNVIDFRSQLTKLKDAKPDALFIDVQAGPAASRILKQVRELKWNVPLIVSDTISGDKAVLSEAGDLLEGAIAAEFNPSNNPRFQKLMADYKQKYDEEAPFPQYIQTIYDSVYVVADGIKAVGYNGEELANWTRTVKGWSGASGNVAIAENGDRAGGSFLKIIKAGKVEVVQ
jgi:branched-chain amino acid transport system substrate-binding protein